MHGFVDQRAVRGAEHRRRRRSGPEGARARCARVGCSTRMYCQTTPPAPRSTGNFAAHDARQNTAVGARPFWLLFGAMPKSNPRSGAARKPCTRKVTRSPAGRVKALRFKRDDKRRRWISTLAEMTSESRTMEGVTGNTALPSSAVIRIRQRRRSMRLRRTLRRPIVAHDDRVQRFGEALRVGVRKMRPLRQVVIRHFRIVLEMDARRAGFCQQHIP